MATINGGAGNDAISGTTSGDQLFGQGGQDNLFGGAGDDLIYGDSNLGGPVTVNNGDFGTNNTSGWTTTGSGTFVYDQQLAFNAGNTATGGSATAQQTIATVVGAPYQLSLDALEFGGSVANHTLVVEVLDSAGQVLGTQTVVIANGSSQTITIDFFAASTRTTLRFSNPTSTGTVNSDLKIDLLPEAPSFITRVCGSDFHIRRRQFGQARRARSPQIAQAFGALLRAFGSREMSAV